MPIPHTEKIIAGITGLTIPDLERLAETSDLHRIAECGPGPEVPRREGRVAGHHGRDTPGPYPREREV